MLLANQLMVSQYSTDQQMAVMRQEIQQSGPNKGKEEECDLSNTDVNNAGFKRSRKISYANNLL